MRFKDATLADIIENRLSWEDFDEPEEDILKTIVASSDAEKGPADIDEETSEDIGKAYYLNESRAGDVVDQKSLRQLDFFSVELTSFARLGLAGGDPDAADSPAGAVVYDHSYRDMTLLIQVMMFRTCAVYIKDYAFGYIKPFGNCVYVFDDEPDPSDDTPEAFLREIAIPRIELDILNGEIDIAKELYDYYHRIPGGDNPKVSERVNADDFMSVQDAAKALDITEGRVKKLIANRTLDGYKIGDERALWLSRAQVQERIDYIAEHGKPTRGKGKKQEAGD